MGLGHVPAGTFREERQGDDFPRRQYRRARAKLRSLGQTAQPRDVGALGESLAALFLRDRGARILDRNLRVGRGEIDLVIEIAGERVAVEVKAGASPDSEPIFHFDQVKQDQVRSLAAQCGIRRVDFLGVVFSQEGVTLQWLPRVC